MVKFDETLNQLNEVIKNKHWQENKQNILRFSPGPTLKDVLNEFKNKNKVGKFVSRLPTFGEIITELRKRSPQDFQEGDEIIYNAYLLGSLKLNGVEINIYLQDIMPELQLIRVFGNDYKKGHNYEIGIVVRGNKLSDYIPVAQYFNMKYDPNNPQPYPSGTMVTKILCTLHRTLILTGFNSGVADVNWSDGDFARLTDNIYEGMYIDKAGKVNLNLAGSLGYMIRNLVEVISSSPEVCESIDD